MIKLKDWMVVELHKDNTLYDVYQTIIGFGNYVQIQYISNQFKCEISFNDDYEVDFQDVCNKEELVIGSVENDSILVISEYNKIDIIKHDDRCVSFEISIKNNDYIIIIVTSD